MELFFPEFLPSQFVARSDLRLRPMKDGKFGAAIVNKSALCSGRFSHAAIRDGPVGRRSRQRNARIESRRLLHLHSGRRLQRHGQLHLPSQRVIVVERGIVDGKRRRENNFSTPASTASRIKYLRESRLIRTASLAWVSHWATSLLDNGGDDPGFSPLQMNRRGGV